MTRTSMLAREFQRHPWRGRSAAAVFCALILALMVHIASAQTVNLPSTLSSGTYSAATLLTNCQVSGTTISNCTSSTLAAGASVTLVSGGQIVLGPVFTANAANSSTGLVAQISASSTTPVISGINPSSAAVGASVVISGSNFGASQQGSTVTFNGTAATATSWSATSITVTVPSGATTGNVVVTVGGVASNGWPFTPIVVGELNTNDSTAN